MSTVSFLAQLDPGIFCLWTYHLNGFKSKVVDNFFLWARSDQLSYILSIFLFFLIIKCLVVAVQPCME